ncbi:MAG: hypothetical protein J2P38_02355 [Candidatus Dormibacteraeota bacterium]|nr:hypothetical protein [Candidatus Dormibacteraeota bacterium]
MISPEVGKLAFTWALLLIMASIGLLFIEKHGSPEFFITIFTLVIGVIFLGLVALAVRVIGR